MSPLPPGVAHNMPLIEVASGGPDANWATYSKVKQFTNAFIKQEDKVSACCYQGINCFSQRIFYA